MFQIEQITKASERTKSGADFPRYIQDIKEIGVSKYTTYVSDGHTVFEGKDNFKLDSGSKYEALSINPESNKEVFIKELKEHQQGKSDYPYFCNMSATNGIEKWVVDLSQMTCTYFDRNGNEILTENIPG